MLADVGVLKLGTKQGKKISHANPTPRDLKYFIFNPPWEKIKNIRPALPWLLLRQRSFPENDEALTDWPQRLSALPGSVPAHLAAPVSAPGSLFSARCFPLLSVVLSSEGSRVVPRRHGLSRGNISLPSPVSYHRVNPAPQWGSGGKGAFE